jgi:hypothetical protein
MKENISKKEVMQHLKDRYELNDLECQELLQACVFTIMDNTGSKIRCGKCGDDNIIILSKNAEDILKSNIKKDEINKTSNKTI